MRPREIRWHNSVELSRRRGGYFTWMVFARGGGEVERLIGFVMVAVCNDEVQ